MKHPRAFSVRTPWPVLVLLAGLALMVMAMSAAAYPADLAGADGAFPVSSAPQAAKTVTGQVLLSTTGAGMPEVAVVAWRLDGPGYASAPTDPGGNFELGLTGGEWHLGVEPLKPPAAWIWPGPPRWVAFALDTTPETKVVIIEVFPTDAWLTGHVICPPADPPCPPQDAILAEARREEIRSVAGLGADYGFTIPIPSGWYELFIHVDHPDWQGPEPRPVFVGPGQTVDVGEIPLLVKDARITGQVRNEMGIGVADVPVVGWRPEGYGGGWAQTDANGTYTMPVIGGEWFVEPQPDPMQPYVYSQRPQLARVAPGGTMAGVDLLLTWAGARIQGTAVEAQSLERIWGLDGWAWAEQILPPTGEPVPFSDAPMWDGGFELKVQGDWSYWVGVNVPPQAPFVSSSSGPVPVPPGGNVPVAVPLEHKNSVIEGGVVLAGTSPPEPAHGVWAEVFGEDERGHWVNIGVDPETAWYELGVISGTWHLRARVDPASGYAALPAPTVVTVKSEQVLSFVNFEVWPISASISGRVRRPDGTPLPGLEVFAGGESPFAGHFEARATTDAAGNFELRVPEGGYVVGTGLPGDELAARGWLNPLPVDVPWVSTASPATGLSLRFRQLDGKIQGTVTFAPGLAVTASHAAFVWGWADSGERAETEATLIPGTDTFTYTMGVVSDTVWHVGAVYEDWDQGQYYESPEATVAVPPTPPMAVAVQDLELAGPWTLPQPFIVSFDGSYMQTIIMPDGVEMVIPPGAICTGTVTLFIFPTQALSPQPGQEMLGPGYEMWAINQSGVQISQFNKQVMITFGYPTDEVLASQGIQEHLLLPVYYSTLLGHWSLADSYLVDTENNQITLQIDHFTKFGVAAREAAGQPIYLPLVLHQQ